MATFGMAQILHTPVEGPITRDDLLARLRALVPADDNEYVDVELIHMVADDLLLAFINDPEIAEAFENVPRSYEA